MIWADAEERDRPSARDAFGPGRMSRYPAEHSPQDRPRQQRGCRAQSSPVRMTLGSIGRNPLSLAMGRQKKQPSPVRRRAVFLEDRLSRWGRDRLVWGEGSCDQASGAVSSGMAIARTMNVC